ncbi:TPA: hypothetical protein LVN28_001827 [Klebsiella oxytoca]|nr:hypothetical protein [Klebsiella oxytoca]
MKPYIMLYSETMDIIRHKSDVYESTTRTFSIETDDDDYVGCNAWTTITKTSEASDDDYIYCFPHSNLKDNNENHSTIITRSLENEDTDYLYMSTIRTNTIESSDDDYIMFY